ncbi:MAG: hypothetical protein ER33_14335 [Cyanobium sp. CACIAM 14]|nr:MAG: hypothetical protein ER33_14335 [Cyanobium sp. CACIAM 14]
MPEPVRLEPFESLVGSLRGSGRHEHAERLEQALGCPCTTSSELIDQLGAVVVATRLTCRPLTQEQKALIRRCLKEVRKAFPGYGWVALLPGLGGWFARRRRPSP